MRIEQAMKKPAFTCTAQDPLSTAARLLADRSVEVVAVIGPAGRMVGLLTEQDIARAVEALQRPPDALLVADAMSREIVACFVNERRIRESSFSWLLAEASIEVPHPSSYISDSHWRE